MNIRHRRILSGIVICFGLSINSGAACGDEDSPALFEDDSAQGANDQNDSVDDTTAEAVILAALTSADPASNATDDELADAASTSAGQDFGGCVTAVIDKNIVTYTLTNCTGPWGFVSVTGTIVGTYTRTTDGALQAQLQGSGIQFNQSTADLKATVVRRDEGAVRTSEVNTDWKGVTADGKPTSRKGEYTSVIDWANGCIGLDGDWVTKVGLYTWNTTVTSYQVCQGQCPDAGSTIVWEDASRTTTLEFDGSNRAAWSNSNDRSGELTLQCGG